ncbi:hypothetical protein [Kistimonas asteriae]|uniref:hypothetical protein n=1 Tax=Kistimonas asteriae TaxID=517724 RepID=UPI001BAB450F|nr:hypothetical protein [Kistimonas asteriae]
MGLRKLFNADELSSRLAEHVMASTESHAWRESLIQEGIFEHTEIGQLSERELALIQRTLLTTRFRTMNEDQLLQAMQQYRLPWRVDLDTEYSAAAVAY